MTRIQEFNAKAIIERLAEMESPCPGMWDGKPCEALVGGHHITCDSTGRIVPFVALRAECPGYNPLGVCAAAEERTGKGMWKLSGTSLTTEERAAYAKRCGGGCRGRGWVPESDVRVACWEIAKVRAAAAETPAEAQRLVDNMVEDSLLLDTEALVKEQHG